MPSRTEALVKEVADQLLVSVPTLYRWLARVERHGSVTCLLRKRRFDAGGKRLDPRVEEIIEKAIRSDYLTELKKPDCCNTCDRNAVQEHRPSCPSKVAVMARIEEILPEERAAKREGRNAALDHRSIKGSMPGADTLNAVWQIDHTPADVILVDEQDRILSASLGSLSRLMFSRGWWLAGTSLSIHQVHWPRAYVFRTPFFLRTGC